MGTYPAIARLVPKRGINQLAILLRVVVGVMGTRQLAAIVFTDAVGFSALMSANEPEALRLIARDGALITKLASQHGGSVVKSTGDGFLLVFASAIQALQCALDIQVEVPRLNTWQPGLDHRIGVHLADVAHVGNDILGDGVNIAARLQQEAPGGGICLSAAVYENIKSSVVARFSGPYECSLKNIPGSLQVYTAYPLNGSSAAPPVRHSKHRSGNFAVVGSVAIAAVALVLIGIAAFKPNRPTEVHVIYQEAKDHGAVALDAVRGPDGSNTESAKSSSQREGPDESSAKSEIVAESRTRESEDQQLESVPVAPNNLTTATNKGEGSNNPVGPLNEPATREAPHNSVTPVEKLQDREAMLKSYDFLALVKLVENSELGKTRAGKLKAKAYRELADLMAWIRKELRQLNPTHRLQFPATREGDRLTVTVWMEDEELVVETGEHRRYTTLKDCPPRLVYQLGTLLLSKTTTVDPRERASIHAQLRLFAEEFWLDTQSKRPRLGRLRS